MRDISNIKHYRLSTNPDGVVIIPNISLKPDDVCLLPMTLNEPLLDFNYRRLFKYVKKGVVLNLSFDVTRIHNLKYDEWMYLINFAKTHNINFKVNEFEEYTPDELENYVNKFSRVKDGKKEMVFETGYYITKNNPLYVDRENDEDILEDKASQEVIYTDAKGFNLSRYIRTVKNKYNNVISFEMKPGVTFNDEVKGDIIRIVDKLKKSYKKDKFDFCFSTTSQYYNKEEFTKLLEVEEYIKQNYREDYELKFTGTDKVFTKEQVINANNKISEVVETLRKSKASPYEKVLYVHKLLSEMEFIKNEKNSKLSRNIYSVLNTRNIICVGYASLFNAIFEELNDENIKVKMDIIKEFDGDNNVTYHALNCIYLNDKKYDIEGYYNIDSCHNASTDNLRNFMIPIKDFKYSYANRSKKAIKILFPSRGTLMDQTYCFDKRDNEILDISTNTDRDMLAKMKSTEAFLDTPMGHKAKESLGIKNIMNKYQAASVIDKCIESTHPIFMAKTYEALVNVSSRFYGMSRYDSVRYSKSMIAKSCFESLFLFRRKHCSNYFAKVSLSIENDLIKVNGRDKKNRK